MKSTKPRNILNNKNQNLKVDDGLHKTNGTQNGFLQPTQKTIEVKQDINKLVQPSKKMLEHSSTCYCLSQPANYKGCKYYIEKERKQQQRQRFKSNNKVTTTTKSNLPKCQPRSFPAAPANLSHTYAGIIKTQPLPTPPSSDSSSQ